MVKFAYVPQEKQALVLSCGFDEILYGGAAGGGKSYTLLMDYANHAINAESEGKVSNGVLFRQTYKELEQLTNESHNIYLALGWKFSKDKLMWSSPMGSRLYLSYLASYEDAMSHRGFEYDWIGMDELTLWATDQEYEYLGTRLRSSKGVRLRRVNTTNPGGPGHNWVMTRWGIDKNPLGMKPIHQDITLADGRVIRKTRIFIPAKLVDNKFLYEDGHYEADLRAKPEHLQKMLLEGRWDVVEGAFFTEWNPDIHIIRPRNLPKEWKTWMAMDWGSSRPYAGLWAKQAPDGTIYIYRELYGDGGSPNKGTYESAIDVAGKIRDIELLSGEYVTERYLDASCWDNTGNETTIADQFASRGVVFQPSYKKKKAASVSIARDWLRVVNGKSKVKVFSSCTNFIRICPTIQIDKTDPEQYSKTGENHVMDAWMYLCRRNIPDPGQDERSERNRLARERMHKQWGLYGAQ